MGVRLHPRAPHLHGDGGRLAAKWPILTRVQVTKMSRSDAGKNWADSSVDLETMRPVSKAPSDKFMAVKKSWSCSSWSRFMSNGQLRCAIKRWKYWNLHLIEKKHWACNWIFWINNCRCESSIAKISQRKANVKVRLAAATRCKMADFKARWNIENIRIDPSRQRHLTNS